jgi:hypothetical protein
VLVKDNGGERKEKKRKLELRGIEGKGHQQEKKMNKKKREGDEKERKKEKEKKRDDERG